MTTEQQAKNIAVAESQGWKRTNDGRWHWHDNDPDYPGELNWPDTPAYCGPSADPIRAVIAGLSKQDFHTFAKHLLDELNPRWDFPIRIATLNLMFTATPEQLTDGYLRMKGITP